MKKLSKYLMLLIVLVVAVSCSKDEPELILSNDGGPFEISELTGNWEATQAVFLRISDNWWVDIVAEGGALSLNVQSDARCTFTINPFDREAYTESGEMFWGSYDGDVALAIVWDDNPNEASFFRVHELNSTTFDLGCSSECGEYDYDNDGNSDVSDLGFDFIRN